MIVLDRDRFGITEGLPPMFDNLTGRELFSLHQRINMGAMKTSELVDKGTHPWKLVADQQQDALEIMRELSALMEMRGTR